MTTKQEITLLLTVLAIYGAAQIGFVLIALGIWAAIQ